MDSITPFKLKSQLILVRTVRISRGQYTQLRIQSIALVQKLRISKPIVPEGEYRGPKTKLWDMFKEFITESIQQFADGSSLLEDEAPKPTAPEKAPEHGGQQECPGEDKTNESVTSCATFLAGRIRTSTNRLGSRIYWTCSPFYMPLVDLRDSQRCRVSRRNPSSNHLTWPNSRIWFKKNRQCRKRWLE